MSTTLVRRDGRGEREMRGKELQTSVFNQFDGSAWYAQGLTTVAASVNGPVAARQEDYRKCHVRVNVTRAARVPQAGGTDRLCLEQEREEQRRTDGETERLLTTFVEAVVLLERFPRCVLEIHVTVLGDDGSLLAVATNAVMCALLDAGVPCRTTIAAVSVAVCAPHDNEALLPLTSSGASLSEASSSASLLLLDPTMAEEATDEVRSVATTTFILSNPNGGGGGVLASNMHLYPHRSKHVKSVSAKDFAAMAALAARAAVTIFTFMQNCGVPLE
ncbi:putative ribosomal RNA processing protein 41B, putative,3 exoribonuclease [Trypanosoma theileri]|uniref:Putative ribosomal RNA processing protein 41B, putative,3 exoribonuclease n=1 Tax=Trypanosoma theileri TaxID=67003 RepID=A0A1X0NK34_9TRYP|nr:putative ribosomal RNA processing protein 41B, putative,3 exoribonuclease [Trypanosoma theileri]ORC85017.1 putative ribosomal RNA processing protein 41B, putative,3 exoribonuclease [Trypanosoma theileri]